MADARSGLKNNVRRMTDGSQGGGVSGADEGADLIVVGSHGRSGIARLMLGSVANKVVAESPVPVLVVR